MSPETSGSQTIRLLVRISNVAARASVVTPDSFRLIVDRQVMSPTEAPIVAIAMQSVNESWVAFRVPPNAGAVVLQVGDVHRETAKIPIDLRTADTAVHDTPAPTWRSPVDLAVRLGKRAGPLMFTVDGARLEHFADAVPPLQPEKLVVSFTVRVENVGAKYPTVLSGEFFRLLVDGIPLAPTKAPIAAVAFQSSLDGEVVFVIPGTATNAVLQVGSVTAETAKVPVDLSAAH